MRLIELFEDEDKLKVELEKGDELLVGKFKNRKATIKGFSTDEKGQPVADTTKGQQKILKPRVVKLMPEKVDESIPWYGNTEYGETSGKLIIQNLKDIRNDVMVGSSLLKRFEELLPTTSEKSMTFKKAKNILNKSFGELKSAITKITALDEDKAVKLRNLKISIIDYADKMKEISTRTFNRYRIVRDDKLKTELSSITNITSEISKIFNQLANEINC